jgi:acetyltransferase-like isoleucine patch superfamily enzyme
MNILKITKNVVKKIIDQIEINGYNQYTIEEYFKKKGYDVGKNNRIFIKDLGSEPYLVKIGNHCAIAEGVRFVTHDGGCLILRDQIPELNVFGKIEVKDNCMIGINSIILPNVTIGPNSVVGAGSVVTKDVPTNTVVAGVPAKIICPLSDYKEKCVKRWTELNLKGPRHTWEEQLKKHFKLNEKKE